jgi:ATP-dependent helicase/nuclease subunit A
LSNYPLFETPHDGKAVIYRSSAGSGKTFTLTKAYLKLVLLDTSRYNEVLAITFTNDAKDEMKNRIIDELTLLAKDENSDMRKAILNDFDQEKVVNIKDVLTSRADTVLNSLLHDYTQFNVSTIDYFFAQLIRHLAKELHLNLGYELDVDSNKALDEAIDLLFAQADKRTLGWLQDFALEKMDGDKGWDIKKNIATLGKKLFHESYLDVEEKLRDNTDKLDPFIKQLQQVTRDFEKNLVAQGKLGLEIAHKHQLEQADFSRGMPYTNLAKIANKKPGFTKPPSKTFMEALSLENWHTKTSEKIDLIAQARDDGMGDVHQRIVELFTGEKYIEYLEAKAILSYIHSYGVLASLAEKVQEYRTTNNLILISDTAFILNKVIGQEEMPFVYEKIGAKYRYILVDEFQDTSTYQWQSLLPFFQHAIDDGGQLFVVGDVKQSIYAWRGGDMKLLLHQVEKDIHVAEENARTLDTNYRSGKNIISFNNAFFKLAPELLPPITELEQFLPDFKKAYKDVEQKSTKDFAGLVKLQFLKSGEENAWVDQAIEASIIEINSATADGYALSDILILTRKRSEASKIANALLNEGLAAISEEALSVTTSVKVKLLISALKYMRNNDDILAITEFNFFSAKMFSTKLQDLTSITAVLTSTSDLSIHPIYEIIEELILLLKIPDNGDIYLQQFLDLALNQSRRGNATINTFLSWWLEEAANENSREMDITLSGSEDAIKIMTIHKAKGLEYPVVILPFVDNTLAPMTNSILWAKPLPEVYQDWGSLPLGFTKSLLETKFSKAYYEEYFKTALESLNLLYVAFTRAVERLYIYSNLESKGAKTGNLLVQVLKDAKFPFYENYSEQSNVFTLGETEKKITTNSKKLLPSRPQIWSSSALSDKLVIDQQQSKLFLSFKSDKSVKVREGIALHQAMAMLDDDNSIDVTLTKLETQQIIDAQLKNTIDKKIKLLFEKIPAMKEWFSGDYEVLNERQILAKGEIAIPDRVMLKDNKAVILDYKREQKDLKHHHQIKKYGTLLAEMGYEDIKCYLIYTDDQTLVEVL